MKNKIIVRIGEVFILAGILIIFFPTIMNTVSNFEMADVINNFDKEISQTSEDESYLIYKKIQDYNNELYESGQKIVDAFSYEDVPINLLEYGYEQNVIGYVNIEKIKVKLPIYLGATKDNMKKGAINLGQTSLPIGGINTNAVIAAHSGMIKNKMFSDLNKLNIGDEIEITNLWETMNYKVCEKMIINPSDLSKIMIQENRDLVTLITCYPYRVNSHRLIVVCERN